MTSPKTNIDPKDIILVDAFKPRQWQIPLVNAFEKQNFKRIICVIHRRAGKDIAAWNIAVRHALRNPGVNIFYFLPTFSQARRVIWDASLSSGHRIIDHFIPPELVASKNGSTMQVRFTNGSLISLMGSDSIDRIVGTNPNLVIFSEYSLSNEKAFAFIQPILRENQGSAIFLGTPRGRNHFHGLYHTAKDLTDWFTMYLGINDTKLISESDVQQDIDNGIISWDHAQQEYFVSWDLGISGSFYGKYVDQMRLDGRIGVVPWMADRRVNTSFDLGWADFTSIIFWQFDVAGNIRIIDFYQDNNKDLAFYAQIINSKPYQYNKHIFPHDVKVHELGMGITRLDKLRQLGIVATESNYLPFADGIEAVRANFAKIFIDEEKCKDLIKSLENYRRKYDKVNSVYLQDPVHDKYSHSVDALRYLVVSLNKVKEGTTAEDRERAYQQSRRGNNNPLDGYMATPGSGYNPFAGKKF